MSTTTVSKAQLEKLMEFVDIDPSSLRSDYSGRAMYGKSCFAFEPDGNVSEHLFIAALAMVIDRDDEQLGEDISAYDLLEAVGDMSVRSDSMGRGTIIYFPGIILSEEAVELLEANDSYSQTY